MKYYAVIGRLPGQHEDSVAVYNPMTEEEAIRRFKFWLRKTYLGKKEAKRLERDEAAGREIDEYEVVHHTFTLSSATPIEIDFAVG